MIIDIDGLNINYVVEGEGFEVLLLHGWGCSIETVMPIFNLLKKNFKVYAIDFPGFGKSDKPKKVFSGEDYAKIVYDFMKPEGIKNEKNNMHRAARPFARGFSFGAYVVCLAYFA